MSYLDHDDDIWQIERVWGRECRTNQHQERRGQSSVCLDSQPQQPDGPQAPQMHRLDLEPGGWGCKEGSDRGRRPELEAVDFSRGVGWQVRVEFRRKGWDLCFRVEKGESSFPGWCQGWTSRACPGRWAQVWGNWMLRSGTQPPAAELQHRA